MSHDLVVFLGPSLDLETARGILNADYRPPARKGDLYRCLGTGVNTIAIIDGVFHTDPSVWHREILEALDEGLCVYGASSMGALRAAELDVHGMVGVGSVYASYRDRLLDGDDEVALLFGPPEMGYVSLSVPLVNMRATVALGVELGLFDQERAVELIDHAKRLFYPDRTYAGLLAYAKSAGWSLGHTQALERLFSERPVDVKRDDAVALLRLLAAREAHIPRPVEPIQWSIFSERLRHRGRLDQAKGPLDILEALDAETKAELRRASNRRWYLLAWAEECGQVCPTEVKTSFLKRFETRLGIEDRAKWLSHRGLAESEYLGTLAEEATVRWLRDAAARDLSDPDEGMIRDWATRLGITHPTGESLVDWLVEVGPEAFGYWSAGVSRLVCRHLLNERGDLEALDTPPGS